MTDIIIGRPDCSVTDVVNLMSQPQDDSVADALKKWRDMARQLKASKVFIDQLNRNTKLDNFSPSDIYHEIFEDWKSRTSEEATLSSLLSAFRKCGLNSTAKRIETHYINLKLYSRPCVQTKTSYQVTRQKLSFKRRIFKHIRSLLLNVRNYCLSCILLFYFGFRYTKPLIIPMLIFIFIIKYYVSTLCSGKNCTGDHIRLTSGHRKPTCSTDTLANISSGFDLHIPPLNLYDNTANITENLKYSTNYQPTSTIEPIVWIPINATISSWKEFQVLMNTNTNNSHIIDLYIVMDNPFDWVDTDNLYNTHRIRSLSVNGRFSLDLLTEIVKKLASLQNLVLDNSENKLCDRNKGQLSLVRNIPENFVYLPMLKFLWLKEFTNCVEILELLVRSYDIKRLKRLAIDEHVDNHNIHHVQELISKFDSLEVLDLHLVNHSNKYFYKSDFTNKSKLSRLYFNSISISSNLSYISVGSDFCSRFEHLSHFENTLGCLPFSEFVYLLNCTKLKSLTVTICFARDEILKDVNLQISLPSLEHFHVKLNFVDSMKCPNISDIKRVGFRERGKTVKEFSISSNCPIRKGKDGKYKNSDFKHTHLTK